MLPPFLVFLAFLIPPSNGITCTRGKDYGGGQCLEPHAEFLDRLGAERVCRRNGMILYYPTNVFDNTRITNLTRQLFPGAGALWIGVTCVDKSDCYTEKGEAIRVGTHLGLYENFFGSAVGPCTQLDATTGFWFGESCRGGLYAPFFCWDTKVVDQVSCPPGTFYYNLKCYGLHGKTDSAKGSDHCNNIGGELVSIHSPIQNAYVYDLARYSVPADEPGVGIGMYTDSDGEMYWYDGSPLGYAPFATDSLPPDGQLPPKSSTIFMELSGAQAGNWTGDPEKNPMFQVCSWPPIVDYNPSDFSYEVNHSLFPQYCTQANGHLPNDAIVYSPNYPDYTNSPCNLTYKMTDSVTIMFPELYLDENSKIDLFTDETSRLPTTTIDYNMDIDFQYRSQSGYLRMEFHPAPSSFNYWRASTISKQYGDLGQPQQCTPSNPQITLSALAGSEFQTYNYGRQSGTNFICTVTFEAQSVNNTVSLTFYDFHIDDPDDVMVYDGILGGAPMIQKPLKGIQPGIRIESSGQYLSLQISTISQGYRGIWADFTSN